MVEELVQLCISTVGRIVQPEALSFVSEVLSIVVGDEESGRHHGSLAGLGAGVSRQADDDVRTFARPVNH